MKRTLHGWKLAEEGKPLFPRCHPAEAKKKLNRYSFLTTGGQAIDDIFKYIPGKSRLGMTQRTLEWRHMAPTAPDTLWIYPFPDADPFIMKHRPDVYIVGNQPEFETTIIGGMTPFHILPTNHEINPTLLFCR